MSRGNENYQATCRKCNGEGDSCSVCQGRGYVQYAYPGRPMSGRTGMGEKEGDVEPMRSGRLHHS